MGVGGSPGWTWRKGLGVPEASTRLTKNPIPLAFLPLSEWGGGYYFPWENNVKNHTTRYSDLAIQGGSNYS